MDFSIVMIIILVYMQDVQYLPYIDMCNRVIDNIVNSKTMSVLGGHMT